MASAPTSTAQHTAATRELAGGRGRDNRVEECKGYDPPYASRGPARAPLAPVLRDYHMHKSQS